MLTVEIKVNGCLLGHAYILNRGEVAEGKYDYDYEFYAVGELIGGPDFTSPSSKRALVEGRVDHVRADGFVVLARKVLEDVEVTMGWRKE